MIRGTEFTNCNCAWGCPCQFGAKSTHGHCETVMCGHIQERNFNDTNLDGLGRYRHGRVGGHLDTRITRYVTNRHEAERQPPSVDRLRGVLAWALLR
jgi:hypothetical protein